MPTATYTPEATTTAVPTATYTPEAKPNYGSIVTPRAFDVPPPPPSGGGVDLASMGLPPLPEAQGLLDPSLIPPEQQ